LGLSGDPEACGVLLDRVSSTRGPIETSGFNEAAESILALGRLAGQDASGAAVTWLMAATEPGFWSQQQLTLHDADGANLALDEVMARLSIMALGVSSDPVARAHLNALLARMNGGEALPDWFYEQVTEALARIDGNQQVLRVGNRALRVQ
jgi:hypothetical protein